MQNTESDIFALSSTVVDDLVSIRPEVGTHLGLSGEDHRWGDTSPAGFEAVHEFWKSVQAAAAACSSATRSEEVAKAVLLAEAAQQIQVIGAGLHFLDLNNIASPWQSIRDIFDQMPDDTVLAWENIIARMKTIDAPLDGYRSCLATGLTNGTLAAQRQGTVAIEQGRTAAGPESGFNSLIGRLEEASTTSSEIADADLAPALSAAIDNAKRHIASMTDWLETDYLPHAPVADAVGRDRYIRSAEQFLGTTIDPDELYAWGWSEIRRLGERLDLLAAKIDSEVSATDVVKMLHNDPERAAHGVDEFVALMQARQEQALADLDGSHFEVPEPIHTIEVKTAPPGGALAPYYSPPSEDFSRPGRVWYPVGDRTIFPLFEEITTAYHEGFPGHHLQVGWQNAMSEELSRFHRLLTWYPGSGEGWALYAETLMGELGYLELPDYEIGLVASQLLRSCRIVIDIGMHCELTIPDDQPFHPGETWSYENAVEMLETIAFTATPMAESEIVRYFGWPGQAISYKVGERAILGLREEFRGRPDFDQKAFHANVLSVGSVGLDLLEELVRSA